MKNSNKRKIAKFLYSILIIFAAMECSNSTAFSREYNPTTFEEFKKTTNSYQTGDVINVLNDINVTSNIGDMFPASGEYTINGNNATLNGNSKTGFKINSQTNLTIQNKTANQNFIISGFKGGNDGSIYNLGTLNLSNIKAENNVAEYGGYVFLRE